MAKPEHFAILKNGIRVWNHWREAYPRIKPDLREINLGHTDLSKIDLSNSNLTEAILNGANLNKASLKSAILINTFLHEANLNRADLAGANLNRADLSHTIFTRSNLSYANLEGANLWGTYFNSTELQKASFRKTYLHGTVFTDCDLTDVEGLEDVEHRGPSLIDIHTFLLSFGRIPDNFLRGAGTPEPLMTFAASLIASGKAIQFYSCFISYSTKDQTFAERLQADLQKKGVRCWFAPHDLKGGRKVHDQIDEAIRVYDRLLLILSDHSMNSEWVKTEIANARQREIREKRQMLFPICLVPFEKIKEWKAFDADTGKDSAREIREYFIPDFSNWKDHDSYEKAFDRLLRDLKAEDKP